MDSTEKIWRISLDAGGTFTDCLAESPDGRRLRAKILSSGALRGVVSEIIDSKTLLIREKWNAPKDFVAGFKFRLLDDDHPPLTIVSYHRDDDGTSRISLSDSMPGNAKTGSLFEAVSPDETPILAAKLVTQTAPGDLPPPMAMRLGTTKGTNALLERRGVPTAFFVTKGFADLLRIGSQHRPELFALEIVKPEPLHSFVVEVDERLDARGKIGRPLNEGLVKKEALNALQAGAVSAAVVLMHGYLNPKHENAVARILKGIGFQYVAVSSELAPLIKITPRAETTVVDAYIGPVIQAYIRRVSEAVTENALRIMTSAGGLAGSSEFRPKDSLLSGPAGGVVGAATTGKRSGFEKIISFDMGGTSTDVSRFDGDFDYVFEHAVGDARLVAPAIAIETVAAGGGSICMFDGQRLRVGPESAGASPGPACYGAGGPLTITDVNLLLGRLNPDQFEIPISTSAAERALDNVLAELEKNGGEKPSRDELLSGFLDIANERMANAIRSISVRKGYDAAEYALVAFGGAGAQHACAIADLLNMRTVIVPQDASLLSALGIGHAVIERFSEKQVLQDLAACENQIPAWLDGLAEKSRGLVSGEGVAEEEIVIRRRLLFLRFSGQETPITVEYSPGVEIRKAFLENYKTTYGYTPKDREIEVESMRVVASSRPPVFRPTVPNTETTSKFSKEFSAKKSVFFADDWREVACFKRNSLRINQEMPGPALIFEDHSAVSVAPGWLAQLDENQAIILRKQ